MVQIHLNPDDLKRKLRDLKKLEMRLRFDSFDVQSSNHQCYYKKSSNQPNNKPNNIDLVWHNFFDLKEECTNPVKYPISRLMSLSKDEFKEVINEYFYHVYDRWYKENGMSEEPMIDTQLLTQLGLPFNADHNDIKKKFKELAKKYHPDNGGDGSMFIELMEKYKKIDG